MAAATRRVFPRRLVIDSSIALSWWFSDEKNDASLHLLKELRTGAADVPSLFLLEVSNALLVGERKGRLTQVETMQAMNALSILPIQVDAPPNSSLIEEILTIARQYALTTYDAAYLELALRLSLPLATLDKSLRRAAKAAGVKVVKV